MESAPSLERTLAVLNAQGHVYLSERALIESCSNGKTLMSIFKDLTEKTEPSYIRSWMATEGRGFFQDIDKNRLCLPAICDYLAASEVMEILGSSLRLSMFTLKSGQRNWMHLNKIISFLQAREEMYKITEDSKSKHQIMLRTFKKVNEFFQEVEKRRKQTINQKERQKPIYDQKIKRLTELIEKVKNESITLNQLTSNNMRMNEELKSAHEVKLAKVKRDNEELEIRIAQCKRELCKITPDIRKRREHIDKKLQEMNERKSYKQNLGQQLVQSYSNYAKQAKIYQQNLAKLQLQVSEELHNIAQQTNNKQNLLFETQKIQKDLSSLQIRNTNEFNQREQILIKQEQISEEVSKLTTQRNEQNGELDWEAQQLNREQELQNQMLAYRKELQKEKEKMIQSANETITTYQTLLQQKNKDYRQWMSRLQTTIKQLQNPLHSFMR